MDSALLFLIFNRPDLTARVFARIREYRPSKLYIAADGPRAAKEGEAKECEASREATESIDWPCEVHRLYRSENLGCKVAVSSAITWFFEHETAGIILEDDCLPELSFFRFAEELLVRYADEPRVISISADNFQQGRKRGEASYYFSRYPHIWGWASWRRVWQSYDVELKAWPASRDVIAKNVLTKTSLNYFSGKFEAVKSGELDTWDFQLSHTALASGALTIIPQQNLIENIGFDSRATHTTEGTSPTETARIQRLGFPLKHPAQISAHDDADRFTEELWFAGKPPLGARIRRRILRMFA